MLSALALTSACKKDEPAPAPNASGAGANTGVKAGETPTPGTGDAKTGAPTTPGAGVVPADRLVRADRFARGDVLGHFVLANPSNLLKKIKTQLVPEAQAALVDESFLRSASAAGLGARSKIATNLDLTKPLGCVVVDSKATTVPVACVLGYTGGAAALVADLGEEGKQADAAGHLAKYTISGQDVFVDDLGGQPVVSDHGDVFAKAQPYLAGNVVGRAPAIVSDVEFVVYPGAAMIRYVDEIAALTEMVKSMSPTPPTSDNALAGALAEYQVKSNARMIERLRQYDQFTLGLGLDPDGFVMRYAGFPTPGTDAEAETKLMAAGPLDPTLVKSLPVGSWGVFGGNLHVHKVFAAPGFVELRKIAVDAYAKATTKDPAAVEAAIDSHLAEAEATYSGQSAFAFFAAPGTFGGFAAINALQPGKEAREGWKRWSAAFTPESVLGAEAAKQVTWSFQMDAAKAGDVAIDRWIIEPTAKSREELEEKIKDKAMLAKFGGLKIVISRVEVDGKVALVFAPGADDKATQRVVDALRGTGSLTADPGLDALLRRDAGLSSMFAMDAKGLIAWMRELAPPDKLTLPDNVGNDLGDLFVASFYGDAGAMSGEVVVSQKLIDQIRALAK